MSERVKVSIWQPCYREEYYKYHECFGWTYESCLEHAKKHHSLIPVDLVDTKSAPNTYTELPLWTIGDRCWPPEADNIWYKYINVDGGYKLFVRRGDNYVGEWHSSFNDAASEILLKAIKEYNSELKLSYEKLNKIIRRIMSDDSNQVAD